MERFVVANILMFDNFYIFILNLSSFIIIIIIIIIITNYS